MTTPPVYPTAARTLRSAHQQMMGFDQPLDENDERYVDTAKARGDFSQHRIVRALDACRDGPSRGYYFLYSGHVGCGKSTELRRLAARLHQQDRFYVVMLDVLEKLDPHNLSYPDVLFALAAELLERLDRDGVAVEPVLLGNLRTWFTERVEKHEKTRELAAEIKAGAEAQASIPFLSKVFATLTNSFKIGSTYKEELRTIVRNSYSDFAQGFNQLIVAAEGALGRTDPGRRILFVVDGTDRLAESDADAFFISDMHQLQQVSSVFLYCAPITLVFRHNAYLVGIYSERFNLPMIKLSEKADFDDHDRNEEGYEAMRRMILKRAAPELFDAPSTLDYLIRHSGGNPRHLMRLLTYAYTEAEDEIYDRAAAEKAVRRLANDYRLQLAAEDFELLGRVDALDDVNRLSDHDRKRAGALLYYGAILEYNSFWWRSHPVVRTLPAYRRPAAGTAPV